MSDHVDDGHGSGTSAGTATEPAHSIAAAQAVGAPRPAALPDTLVLGPSTPTATVGTGSGTGFSLTPAFDAHHPPDKDLADDCVHCGFCLPACPTYLLWGEEMDSPRGRIYQMEAGLAGAPLDDTMVRHMDQCLGCMACVTACPSGVQFHKLIEATRAQIDRRHRRSWTDRARRELIFRIFPYPKRLRALRGPLRAYQASHLGAVVSRLPLPPLLRTMEELAPTLGRPPAIPARTPAGGTHRHTVGLLLGCVQGAFFPDVNAATVRVLAAEGCEVIVPAGQGCCGALSAHSGREEEALRFARALIDTFDAAGVETVISNAAGCGSNMKDYAHLLRDDPAYAERAADFAARVRDITEYLVEIGPVATRHPLELRVAYHDPCHLQHAQGLRRQPRSLLTAIPGLELVEVAESEMCCGSAGIYNLLQPEAAAELGSRKARHVFATGAELLVTGNPGCWMQIATTLAQMGHQLPVTHTIQMVDASLTGLSAPALIHQSQHGAGTPQTRR